MTLAKVISMCDEAKPNQYDISIKTQWINEVENLVIEGIVNRAEGNDMEFTPYDYDTDSDAELVVPDVYSDIYINYVFAKIDFMNAEFGRYNNSAAMYQASYDTYASAYRRSHMPKQAVSLSGC